MNLTPRFDAWLEMLRHRDQMFLSLVLVAGAFVIVVLEPMLRRHRRKVLWGGAVAFWFSLAVMLVINPIELPRPTFGVLIGQPLWYDETFTWAISRLPVGRMLEATAGDVHPPLWYLISGGALRLLGRSEDALRLPALLLGMAAVPLTYCLARALGYERKASIFGAGLLAVMPAHLYYAQEARMYALLQVAVLLTAIGMVIRKERFWGWLLIWGGWTVALYAHNLAVFYVAVMALKMLVGEIGDSRGARSSMIRRVPVTTLAVGAATLLAWAPWARVLVGQVRDVGSGFWLQDQGLGGYLLTFYRMTLGMGAPDFIEQHAAMVAVGLLTLSIWAWWRDQERGDTLIDMVILPPVLLAIVSEVWRPVYLERVWIASLPFFCVLVSAALDRLRSEHRRPILAVLVPTVAICLIFASKGTLPYYDFASEIESYYNESDVIYHANLASYIQLSWYLPDATHICWPDAGNLEQALTVETQRAMGIQRAEATQIWDGKRSLLVVWIENPLTTVDEAKALERAIHLGRSRRVVTWEESELVEAGVWKVRPWELVKH